MNIDPDDIDEEEITENELEEELDDTQEVIT